MVPAKTVVLSLLNNMALITPSVNANTSAEVVPTVNTALTVAVRRRSDRDADAALSASNAGTARVP
jgi:hypothetical protein